MWIFTSEEFEISFWNKTFRGGFLNVIVHATVQQRYRLTSRFQSISYVMREKDWKAQSFHPPGPSPHSPAPRGWKISYSHAPASDISSSFVSASEIPENYTGMPNFSTRFRHPFEYGEEGWKISLVKIILQETIIFADMKVCILRKLNLFSMLLQYDQKRWLTVFIYVKHSKTIFVTIDLKFH